VEPPEFKDIIKMVREWIKSQERRRREERWI
jgi:hypothetical protein